MIRILSIGTKMLGSLLWWDSWNATFKLPDLLHPLVCLTLCSLGFTIFNWSNGRSVPREFDIGIIHGRFNQAVLIRNDNRSSMLHGAVILVLKLCTYNFWINKRCRVQLCVLFHFFIYQIMCRINWFWSGLAKIIAFGLKVRILKNFFKLFANFFDLE